MSEAMYRLTNLLEETQEVLQRSGYTPEDITFIGSMESGHQCTWEEFKLLADIYYDSGYGIQKVARDLIIVFADGSKLRRNEFNGAEAWRLDKCFIRPSARKAIKELVAVTEYGGEESLNALNPL